MDLHCCQCNTKVKAKLTDGSEIYPHRPDLYDLPFWKCETCGNFVGCHHKTKNRTAPLGCIPNKEISNARKHIHAILDPLWQSGKTTRRNIYSTIAKGLGRKSYHTANIRTLEEARKVYRIVRNIRDSMESKHG